MLGFGFVVVAGLFVYRLLGGMPMLKVGRKPTGTALDSKIHELTEYASRLRAGKKFLAAEKVYLQILKLDHKHVQTYSRLGTLYTILKNYNDAVECFQIAAQLTPSGATYYNLGLAFYEMRRYDKAVAAFEKSIIYEPSVQRYVALAKVYQKLNQPEKMISALQQAVDLEPHEKVMWLLADAYDQAGREEDREELLARLRTQFPRSERSQR